MIPYEVDPSLHTDQPHETRLDDGFSPPPDESTPASANTTVSAPQPVDPSLWKKSDF